MSTAIAPYIFYNESFLDEDSILSITDEVRSWTDWIPAHAGRYKDDKIVESKQIKELRDVLVNRRSLSYKNENALRFTKAMEEIRRLYEINLDSYSRYVVSKYKKGCHIRPHSDTDFFNTSRVVTGVFYLGEDYSGGEIFFPHMKVSLKPRSGSLLLFFSEYVHGVYPITDGERISIVWFATTTIVSSK